MRRIALAAFAVLAGGCSATGGGADSALGFYAQAVGGHLDILQRTRPVSEWLADPETPEALRRRLQLSQRIRDFAVAELKLPDNRSYRGYADLRRDAAVWNVVAAPELSLTLKTWCFPMLGCVGYRGYFDRRRADALAESLRAQGLETSVYRVPAYSTLGWTDWLGGDPLLNTFIGWPEGELARVIFHELAHQVVYAADDTTFNESFATAVERIGGRRWLAQHAGTAAREEYLRFDARRQAFRRLAAATRESLRQLYAGDLPDAVKRRRKDEIMAAMRAEHAALKAGAWDGFSGYDSWFAQANNAALGVLGAYDELVPAFERLFEAGGGDFERFYARVAALAALPKPERHAKLAAES